MTLYHDLLEYLDENAVSGRLPMHMPGHKRTTLGGEELPWHLDITEIDGFDNLHEAKGILREGMELAAQLYGSRQAFYLVNGSTGGILAAIASAVSPGSTILMARGCHKSVYHAVELLQLHAVYLLPQPDELFGVATSISPEAVKTTLAQHPEIRLVVLTSPTYEGVLSDVASIASICHSCGIPLLVDEAHGAHLYFHPDFPTGAVTAGADLVIQSVHKTLPSLTQTALAHVQGDLIDPKQLAHYLAVFQTSSPSYLLMGSIHRCLKILEFQGTRLFSNYVQNLKQLDDCLSKLQHLQVLCHGKDTQIQHPGFFAFDPGKVLIGTHRSNLNGPALGALLRQRGIEPEMIGPDAVLAMTSCCDPAETFTRLSDILLEIDRQCHNEPGRFPVSSPPLPPTHCTIAQARRLPSRSCCLEHAIGHVMAESIWAYPPGSPLVLPGEVLTPVMEQALRRIMQSGVQLHSDSGLLPHHIMVADLR